MVQVALLSVYPITIVTPTLALLWTKQLRKILIFGNSGSGKSTLAQRLVKSENLAHLDLDTLAWLPTNPPQRAPLNVSSTKIKAFTQEHSGRDSGWVIEGCYTDLLDLIKAEATEIIFMNLPISQCIENARNRPWESHKYPSKEAQDKNLAMLIDWIQQYESRTDVFSYTSHLRFYESFDGPKTMHIRNS